MNLIKFKKWKKLQTGKILKTNEYLYSLKFFRTINTFRRDIYNVTISLLVEIMNFKIKMKPQNSEKKQKKKDILKNLYALFDGREKVLDSFKSGIFPIKIKGTGISDFDHSNLKILTPKQMLQRLSIALTKVKASKGYKNLLKEVI